MRTRIPRSIRCITSKWFLLACCAVLFFAAYPQAAFAQVAPTSLFQLDGTAALNSAYPPCTYSGGTAPCDFWDLLNGNGTGGSAGHSSVRTFISGEASTEVFIGGGSKDPIDVTSWKCTSKSSPDKDTLTNGYAAAYSAPNGDLVTIFGADRFSVNGDANIGIWFFQQSVICNPSTGAFSNKHTTNDILVLSAFTVGGTIPTIQVFRWQPACLAGAKNPVPPPVGSPGGTPNSCADTNLEVLFSAGSLCDSSGTLSTLAACAITNSGNIQASWPYPTATSSTPSTIPAPAFFTGGADITSLLQTPVCFTSFLEETRSSQSTTAVLKDFIGGAFPVCHVKITKTVSCDTFNASGSFNYSYSGNVINDGGGPLFNVSVVDVKGQSYSCGTIAAGASKAFGGVPLSADCSITPFGASATFTTTDHPSSNLATVTADTSPTGGAPPVSATTGSVPSTDASLTSCVPNPNLTVSKSCVTNFQVAGSQIVVRVDYTGTVTNTGGDNLNNIRVTDSASSTSDTGPYGPFLVTLAPNQSICYTNGQIVDPSGTPPTGCPTLSPVGALTTGAVTGAGFYFPNGVANVLSLGSAGRIQFSDTVSATATDAFGASIGPVTATAQCPICPFGQCALQ